MPDYHARTGEAGTMMIRDTGTNIEFWIKSDYSATFIYGLAWKLYYDGVWQNMTPANYPTGAQWFRMGSINVSGNQSICFHIDATGTAGLGGPTDFWYDVKRATVPGKTVVIGLDQITSTSMRYRFSIGSDGGSPFTEHQMAYGRNIDKAEKILVSGGNTTVTDLEPGVRYYFWSRAKNAVGYGEWSNRIDAVTLTGVRIKTASGYKSAIVYVKFKGAWRKAKPFVKHAGKWKEGI